jgi:hypothetical protein
MTTTNVTALKRFLADINLAKAQKLLTMFLVLSTSIAILVVYRRGGVVDSVYGLQNSPGFRDTGIYARAAEQLFSKLSPYSDPGLSFRSGSFGVLIFGLLPMGSIAYICYQILNLLGIIIFCKIFLNDLISRELYLSCLALGICFSCVREIFSTGQITGILAGLIAIGFQGLKSQQITRRLGGAFLFSLAVDLKPNLFIFFIAGSFILLNRTRDFWMPIAFLLGGHLAIDVYVGRFLERDWVITLMNVSDPTRDPSNTGTRTIWPLIKNLFGIEIIPSQIPTLVFIILGCALLYYISETKSYVLLFLTLIVPAFYNYYHLYSFYPFAILVFAILVQQAMPITLGVMLPFLLVSGGHFGLSQLLFCTVLAGGLLIFLNLANPVFCNANFNRKFALSVVFVNSARLLFQIKFGSTWIQEVIILNCLILVGVSIMLWVFMSKRNESSFDNGGVSS